MAPEDKTENKEIGTRRARYETVLSTFLRGVMLFESILTGPGSREFPAAAITVGIMKNCKIPVRDPAAGEILLSSAVYRRKDRGMVLLILILACRGRCVKKIMKISIKYAGLEIVCCIQNA